ncbi:MAG: hypothetical protein LBP58_01470 [Azoarcus sp.]|jgi:hypothetical protein|nr:hypothetical protein [Azoarcus sp.]
MKLSKERVLDSARRVVDMLEWDYDNMGKVEGICLFINLMFGPDVSQEFYARFDALRLKAKARDEGVS